MNYNKKKSIFYIKNLYNPKEGIFDYSKTCKGTILSTDFAVSTLNLLGEENFISKNKKEIVDYLLGNKNQDNLFVDSNFRVEDLRKDGHKEDYITFQFTFFSLIALDILGTRFDKLPFLEKYLDENYLRAWFDGLDWKKFWYESNKIMFMMYFLSYLDKYGNSEKKQQVKKCIELCFEVLNSKQDESTGYWGTNLNGNDLKDGALGASHIFLFYDYFKKDIQYKERIIDSTLKLHSKNGLAVSVEGGACEDYDLIEIYLRVLKKSEYGKSEIIENLEKMKKEIIESQNKDGGFSYRFYKFRSLLERAIKYRPKKITYKYSSWKLMEASVYHSDAWATYFRLLSLAIIDLILENKKDHKSYNLPGWGYIE